MTIVPLSAFTLSIARSSARSAMNWMFSSMVSIRLSPGCGSPPSPPRPCPFAAKARTRCPGQIVIEAPLQATESVVVGAHVAKHLRGQRFVGIEALELFLEVDAFQVERLHPCNGRRIELAGDPGK